MKRARLIVLAIAFAAAGGAALIAKRLAAPPPAERVEVETRVGTIDVLVASKEIRLGDAVGSGDMKWQAWPQTAVSQGYVTRERDAKAVSSLSGSIARAPFLEGEPIKEQKLIKASEGGVMAAILDKGMRAISTPIREETAAGGFILPNDRVDVIVSRRVRNGRGEDYVSDTVLRNVRVLAIGQTIEQKGSEKVANGKTATLELTPRQAETLALARSMGEISLSLRSLSDTNQQEAAADDNPFAQSRGTSVKMLKYSVPSRAYGLN